MTDIIEHWTQAGVTLLHRLGRETPLQLAHALGRLTTDSHWPPARGLIVDLRALHVPRDENLRPLLAHYQALFVAGMPPHVAFIVRGPMHAHLKHALQAEFARRPEVRVVESLPAATQWVLPRASLFAST